MYFIQNIFLHYLDYFVEIWGNTQQILTIIGIVFYVRGLDHTQFFSTTTCTKISRYNKTENIIIYVQSILQLFVINYSACVYKK